VRFERRGQPECQRLEVVQVIGPPEKAGQELHHIERCELICGNVLADERAFDELLEVFNRRLAAKDWFAHTPGSTRPPSVQGVFRRVRRMVPKLYNSALVSCPLCAKRKGRRWCPALNDRICAECCGTKRLIQIDCPSDCPYLVSSREHPPAVKIREQQRELATLFRAMRDLNERQANLFFLILSFVARYEPPDLHVLVDDDVTEAAGALGATVETAVRGVIYEHRPASIPADRLVGGLKPLLEQAGQNGGTAFQRDAAVVLRRVESAAREARETGNRRAFVELAERVTKTNTAGASSQGKDDDSPRIIIP
jgi:hypothetical protein